MDSNVFPSRRPRRAAIGAVVMRWPVPVCPRAARKRAARGVVSGRRAARKRTPGLGFSPLLGRRGRKRLNRWCTRLQLRLANRGIELFRRQRSYDQCPEDRSDHEIITVTEDRNEVGYQVDGQSEVGSGKRNKHAREQGQAAVAEDEPGERSSFPVAQPHERPHAASNPSHLETNENQTQKRDEWKQHPPVKLHWSPKPGDMPKNEYPRRELAAAQRRSRQAFREQCNAFGRGTMSQRVAVAGLAR